jgi:hypothetical protein
MICNIQDYRNAPGNEQDTYLDVERVTALPIEIALTIPVWSSVKLNEGAINKTPPTTPSFTGVLLNPGLHFLLLFISWQLHCLFHEVRGKESRHYPPHCKGYCSFSGAGPLSHSIQARCIAVVTKAVQHNGQLVLDRVLSIIRVVDKDRVVGYLLKEFVERLW